MSGDRARKPARVVRVPSRLNIGRQFVGVTMLSGDRRALACETHMALRRESAREGNAALYRELRAAQSRKREAA